MKVYLNGKLQNNNISLNEAIKFLFTIGGEGKVIRMSEYEDVANIDVEELK